MPQQTHDDFWGFVLRRHLAWYERFVKETPAPWTNDPYLAEGRYTNVYRELDRGTQYAVVTILEGASEPGATARKLFMLLAYRYLNRIASFEAARACLDNGFRPDFEGYEAALREHASQGHQLFTGAYQAMPRAAQDAPYAREKAKDSAQAIRRWTEHVYRHVAGPLANNLGKVKAFGPRQIYEMCRTVPEFGKFMGWQLACDLMTPLRAHGGESLIGDDASKRDAWCELGPGAHAGLKLLHDRGQPQDLQEAVRLTQGQVMAFRRLEEQGAPPFPYVTDWSGAQLFNAPRCFQPYAANGVEALARAPQVAGTPVLLSLANVEHALCEYQKYVRQRAGGATKKYKGQRDATHWVSPTVTLPAWEPR